MRCARCGASNPPNARFCCQCGAGLGDGARTVAIQTPRHLAERILGSRSALVGERKQVTVLFADVTGSMALAEDLDPEAWHAMMERFCVLLSEGVHRFEGTVNQYTGDGIMALFGAPLAHEDHARRACHAALVLREDIRCYADELRRTAGLSFSARMGLNSGEVVVGAIGDDLRMEYTAHGHTVGLAARMEQLAAPGSVYLTEHTAALIEGFFRLRDLGLFAVKGVREPVRVHELEGVGARRSRFDVSRARGLSRFVGREQELATLEAALSRAAGGEGQVVAVMAEAGVGKSRLCHEFAASVRARGIAIHEAHCLPHARMLPFLPVLELLRALGGVGERDADEEVRRKIAGTLLLLDPELTGSLPLLFDFLGVPDPERLLPRIDPEARERRLLALTRRLVEARGRQPLVLLVEDLHWIDEGSEAFVSELARTVPRTRALLLVNFRPEYERRWRERAASDAAALRPLGPDAIAGLLDDLLGRDPTLAGLAARICERTGGNPFFIEEIVQALVEGGSLVGVRGAYRPVRPLDEPAIPATVQAVLAARIDRLTECDKEVLQTAAVIGKDFSVPVLERVSELPTQEVAAALRTLVAGEFLYEDPAHPEGEYSFKHPLTQEVAYRSQLAHRRTGVHCAAARAIVELYPEKLDERAALVAHHWEAGDPLEAARWYGRAAVWAGVRDVAETVRCWRRVRVLLQAIPETPETIVMGSWTRFWLLNLGWRVGISDEEAAALFSEGKALVSRMEEPRILVGLLSAYGVLRGMSGEIDEALALVSEANALAEASNDLTTWINCRAAMVQTQCMAGQLRAALQSTETERAVESPGWYGALPGFSPYLWLVMMRGGILVEAGLPREGEQELARAERLARERGEDEILGWTHEFWVGLAEFTGDARGALHHARRAVEIAERIGSALSTASAFYALGLAHVVAEEWEAAVSALERELTVIRERHTALHWEARVLALLAEALLGRGEAASARAVATEAAAMACRRGTRTTECRAQLSLARVLRQTDGEAARETAAAAVQRALALVEDTGGRVYEPFARLELAELARLGGDEARRLRELGEARRLFEGMGLGARAAELGVALER